MTDPLTTAEAARLLGLDASSVRRLARGGLLKGKLVGRDWLFSRADVAAFKRLDRARPGRPRKSSQP